jgi:hypothetical protein
MREAAERLLAMVSGPWSHQAIGDLQADLRTDDGVFDAALTLDDPPGAIWRFVGTNAGPCMFMALELVRPDAAQRFAPILKRMCATKKKASSPLCTDGRSILKTEAD